MNTQTPETDSMVEQCQREINVPTNPVPAEFARNLERMRDEFARRLQSPVRCVSGHERLPLALWDCPDCVQKIRDELAEVKGKLELAEAVNQLSLISLNGHENRHEEEVVKLSEKYLAVITERDQLIAKYQMHHEEAERLSKENEILETALRFAAKLMLK